MLPNIELIHLEDPYVTGVAIEAPDSEKTIYLLPFPTDKLETAFPINENEIILIGHSNSKHPPKLLISVFDISQNSITRQRTHQHSTDKYILSKDGSIFYGLGRKLLCIDTQTLEQIHVSNHVAYYGNEGRLELTDEYLDITNKENPFHSEEHEKKYRDPNISRMFPQPTSHFIESEKYKILLISNETKYNPGSDKGSDWQQFLYKIDLSNNKVVKRTPLMKGKESDQHKLSLKLLCAAGKYGVSYHTTFVPFSTGTDKPTYQAFGLSLEDVGEHRDVRLDGIMRFGIALRFWDLSQSDPEPETHIVRMLDASEWTRGYFNKDCSFVEFEQGLIYDTIKINNNLKSNDISQHEPVFMDRQKKERTVNAIDSDFSKQRVYNLIDDPDNDSYWVVFSDDCVRHISYTGEVGPLIRLEMPRAQYNLSMTFETNGDVIARPRSIGCFKFHRDREAYFMRGIQPFDYDKFDKHREAFTEFALSQIATTINLEKFDADACVEAIKEQTRKIECNYNDMVYGGSLKFFYNVSGVIYNEEEFFDLIIENNIDIISELRHLLKTYLVQIGDGGEGKQTWQNLEIPALGSAMNTLLVLDSGAIDIFKDFLAKRDGEHESYCREVIIPTFQKVHGWKCREAVAAGIYSIINFLWGGLHFNIGLDEMGLFEEAREVLEPQELAHIILKEAKSFRNEALWLHQEEDWYVSCFINGLDPKEPFQRSVAAQLSRLRPDLKN